MTDQPDWTEQARRVVAGLSGVLGGAFGGSFGGMAPSASAAEPGAGAAAAPDCRWCPLCQTAAMLRGERPELSAAMADVLATAAEALRSVAAERTAASPDGTPAGRPAADQDGAGETAAHDAVADPDLVDLDEPPASGHEGPAVQRIEIG